jgi:hypothetical protein
MTKLQIADSPYGMQYNIGKSLTDSLLMEIKLLVILWEYVFFPSYKA